MPSEAGNSSMSEHMEASRPSTMLGATDGLHIPARRTDPRLSFRFEARLLAGIVASFGTGVILGLSHGAQAAGLRFRAENAHRLPNTSTGWYLYHKSKNYHIALGGVQEGLKMGTKVGFWVGSYFVIEEAIDRVRGGKADFLSSVVAGMSVAGGFSLWNRFPLVTTARTARVGLLSGLAFGLAQDALALAKGQRLYYVDMLLGKKHSQREQLVDRI